MMAEEREINRAVRPRTLRDRMRRGRTRLQRLGYNGYAEGAFLAFLAVTIVTFFRFIDLPHQAILLLPAVLITSLRWGVGPGVTTAFLTILSYATIFRSNLVEADYLWGLIEALAISFIIVVLAGRARRSTAEAKERERMQSTLRKLGHDLAAVGGIEELAGATVDTMRERLGYHARLFIQEEGTFALLASSDIRHAIDPAEMEEIAMFGSDATQHGGTRRIGEYTYYPLLSAGAIIGMLGVRLPAKIGRTAIDRHDLLRALTITISAAVQRELLARKSLEADLIRKHEELYAALLSSISHDFRTPLASIIGASETLAMPQAFLSERARQDMVAMIREESERLNRFVSNLLDMTKLESGRLDPNLEPIDIADIAGTAIMRTRRTLNDYAVEVDIPPDMPMVLVDFVLMEHVMTNLLENAIKFSPKGTRIRIESTYDADAAYIRVVDEGRGVPAVELEKIFEKFYRVQRKDSVSAGTGLGLSICRGIVAAHGGNIKAVSPVEEGRGTMIVISLPLKDLPTLRMAMPVEEREKGEGKREKGKEKSRSDGA